MDFQLLLKLAIVLSIVLLVFSLSLKARSDNLLYDVRHWHQGLRAVIAIFVVVPVCAILMCLVFDLKPATKIAIIALAVSPIPPILPKSQIKAGGHADYVTGLFVLATLVSIIATPLALALISGIFQTHAYISTGKLVQTLLITCGLPLGAGLIAAPLLRSHALQVSAIAGRLGSLLLVVGLLILLVMVSPAIMAVLGDGTLIALIVMSIAGLIAGYLLGGPDHANRITLAMASAARHPGIAIAVAVSSFPDEKLAPAAIILGALIGTVISSIFVKLLQHLEQPEAKAAL